MQSERKTAKNTMFFTYAHIQAEKTLNIETTRPLRLCIYYF